MQQGSWSWKEDGCRKDCSMLDGRTKSKCEGCHKEDGTERHGLFHCPSWSEVRHRIPEDFRKCEQKLRTSQKEWKWQRGIVAYPPSESHWNRDHTISVKIITVLTRYRPIVFELI